jgi:1,4-dihydroxy-2-naphthoate octaprenyltransferase
MNMRHWIAAARPKTLPAAVAPVVVGGALAVHLQGGFCWGLAICTLLSAVAIQIATNFFNDALDFDKGADTSRRLGPVRATSAGLLGRRAMYWAGGLTLLAACLLALPLIYSRGWMILLIGLPSLYFSFGYTGGPLPLAYRGLGDFFVLLFFGLIAVSGTVFVLTGTWPPHGWVAGFQLGLLSTVLIAINNLRDVAEDRTTNKRTLAVRFGSTFARVEISLLCLLPHLIGIYFWKGLDLPQVALWPVAVLPIGLVISTLVWKTEPSVRYNRFLALSAAQLVLFTALLSLALVKS